MEFPELGTHCAMSSCSRLDFLPFECDACHKIFCKEHQSYELHNCTEAYVKDVRVPVCPLCSQPVPVNRGDDPNVKVDEHIQKDCQSDKARKTYTNRCSYSGCKKKELVVVTCNTCHKNFCLKHRFETDHECQGPPNSTNAGEVPRLYCKRQTLGLGGGSRARRGGTAPRTSTVPTSNKKPQMTALSQIGADLNRERLQRRQQQRSGQRTHQPAKPNQTQVQSQQLSEDEALALAIAASMDDTTSSPSRPPSSHPPSSSSHPPPSSSSHPPSSGSQPNPSCEDDEALARAIAASLIEEDRPRPKPKRTAAANQTSSTSRPRNKDGECTVS